MNQASNAQEHSEPYAESFNTGGSLPVSEFVPSLGKTRASVLLAGSKVVAFGLQLVAVRYQLRWLGETHYGLLLLVQVWSACLSFLDPNLSVGAQKRLTEALSRGDAITVHRVAHFQVTSSLACGVLGATTLVAYGVLFTHDDGHTPSLLLIALVAAQYLGSYVLAAFSALFAAGERFTIVASVNLAQSLLSTVLSLALVSVWPTVEWLATGMALGVLLPAIISGYLCNRLFFSAGSGGFDRSTAGDVTRLSLRSYGNRIASVLASRSDRLVIGSRSPAQLTAYAVACRVPEVLCDVLGSLVQTSLPELTRAHTEDPSRFAELVERNARLTLSVACSFILLPCVFSRSILSVWLGSDHAQAYLVLLLMGGYRTLELLYIGYTSAFYAMGIPQRMFKFALFNAIATAALSYPCYRYGGLLGIGVMNMAINVAQFAPITFVLRRHVDPGGKLSSYMKPLSQILVLSIFAACFAHIIEGHSAGHEGFVLIALPFLSLGWMSLLCRIGLCPIPDPITRLLRDRSGTRVLER